MSQSGTPFQTDSSESEYAGFHDAITSLPLMTDLSTLIDQELSGDKAKTEYVDFSIIQEKIVRETEILSQKKISPSLSDWVDSYSQVGDRKPYLWPWCRQGVELTTLSCVLSDKFDELCDTKVLGVMFDVLMDDVADQRGNEELLEKIINWPFADYSVDWGEFNQNEQHYAAFTRAVWNEIISRLKSSPRYEEFKDLLRYDYLQLFNTMRYSYLLNRFPSMLNLIEHDLYLPHNMHMMISATIDLMYSPNFDFNEIGLLREAIWNAQYMGRIGNLITTWQRELGEGDFTSGVFAHAVIYGDLSIKDLASKDREYIENTIRVGQHEAYYLQRWQDHRRRLLLLEESIQTVDLGLLIQGLERLICLHLASRGSK